MAEKENRFKSFFNMLWEFFKPLVKEYLIWRTRPKSVFKWGVRILTITILTHFGNLLISPQFEPLYDFLTKYFGLFSADIAKVLIFIFFPEAPRWLSLLLLLVEIGLLVFFALLEYKKYNNVGGSVTNMILNLQSITSTINNTYNYVLPSGKKWVVNQEWIDERDRSLYGALSNVKYTKALHVKTPLENGFIEILTGSADPLKEIDELIEQTKELAGDIFVTTGRIRNRINDKDHPLSLDKSSPLYEDFDKVEKFAHKVYRLFSRPERLMEEEGYNLIDPEGDQWATFPIQVSELNELINTGEFDLIQYAGKEDEYEPTKKREVFNAFMPFLRAYRETNERLTAVRSYIGTYYDGYLILHAEAGMGKTHFAASLYERLKSNEHIPFFLKGSDFSGANTNLPALIMKLFEVPDDVRFEHFLESLNDYAAGKEKSLVFIIDSLNETTYMESGFSPIWRDHLQWLIKILDSYEHIQLVVTFRDSYFDLIDPERALRNTHQLRGFTEETVQKQAIEAYFDHFKLKDENNLNELPEFFKFPLMLNLFCRSKNPEPKQEVKVNLANETYLEVLSDYVFEECSKVSHTLGYALPEATLQGIKRNSDSFLNQAKASLSMVDFLVSTDDKPIDQIFASQSKGCHLLNSEAVFMKEKVLQFDHERVVHTFQNVGGYLLALSLISQYPKPTDFVNSGVFKQRLAGAIVYDDQFKTNNDAHQLWSDIMRFVVMIFEERGHSLMKHSQDLGVMKYSMEYFAQRGSAGQGEILRMKLLSLMQSQNGWYSILEYLRENDFKNKKGFNFFDISHTLRAMSTIEADLHWSRFVYVHGEYFQEFLNQVSTDLDNTWSTDIQKSRLEAVIWLLNTTIEDIRDSATFCLIKYGTEYPENLFERLIAFSTTAHTYIYERLALAFYGVCLRSQNDKNFVENLLPSFSKKLYDLQFAQKPIAPSYNYLVIDSFKHLVDLALLKGAIEITKRDQSRLKKYDFSHPQRWKRPTKAHHRATQAIYLDPYHGTEPDPLKGDFVNYTIPRLIKPDERPGAEMVAQVYRRILDLGYKPLIWQKSVNDRLANFYDGKSPSGVYGKTERLGKKYSWMAYFDYAGYLLKRGKLDVFYTGDDTVSKHYERLSDVRIEPSLLVRTPKLKLIEKTNLLTHRTEKNNWTNLPMYDVLWENRKHTFDGIDYIMLDGKVEENMQGDFEVRSFVSAEAYLVKKDDLAGRIDEIQGREIPWKDDIHWNHYLSNTYFGELYWADNIPDLKSSSKSIPTGKYEKISRKLTLSDIHTDDRYSGMNRGELVEEEREIKLEVELEPAVVEYSWESGSNIFPSVRKKVPSENLGKFLDLKADPKNFQLLDSELNLATKHFYHEGDLLNKGKVDGQEFLLLRADLLKRYLDARGLVLMYQMKQRTYDQVFGDQSWDFSGMQYFFPDLD